MSMAYDTINSLVSIAQFNKGHAAEIFKRLNSENQLIVLNNNVPAAVIISPDEFIRLSEIAENYFLLTEAHDRLEANSGKKLLSECDVLKALNLSEKDIENAEELDIE